jgi:hypothetical protein
MAPATGSPRPKQMVTIYCYHIKSKLITSRASSLSNSQPQALNDGHNGGFMVTGPTMFTQEPFNGIMKM